MNASRRRLLSAWTSVTALAGLAGCGFALRQTQDFPFKTLYANFSATSPLGVELRRNLLTNLMRHRASFNALTACFKTLAKPRDRHLNISQSVQHAAQCRHRRAHHNQIVLLRPAGQF